MENLYLKLLNTNEQKHKWELGDLEYSFKHVKSADLVNHCKRCAIEVKDDLSDSAPDMSAQPGIIFTRTRNLLTISNRYKKDIQSAHKKFKSYPEYQTAILIRFNDFTFQTIHYLLGGLVRLDQSGKRLPNLNHNILRDSSNCSIFVFHNIRYDAWEFYKNPFSERKNDQIVHEIKKLSIDMKEITESDIFS